MGGIKNKNYINKIIHADAADFIARIDDESIDLVLTDPPYFLDKLDNTWSHKKVASKKNQKVVKSLPAGMKFDRNQGKKLYDWYLEISRDVYRILKPGAFFLSFSSPRLYHRMASAVDDAGFAIRDCFLWIYTQNQAKAMGLEHFIEKINISHKNKLLIKKQIRGWKTPQVKSCFEPIVVAQKPPEKTFLKNFIQHKVGLINTNLRVGADMFPSNILTSQPINEIMDKYFIVAKPSKKEKGSSNRHLTVKPLSLCEHLIRLTTFSRESLVLDPFVGSGTTAVAALKTNRKFIACDINSEYVKLAKKRIKEQSSLLKTNYVKNTDNE